MQINIEATPHRNDFVHSSLRALRKPRYGRRIDILRPGGGHGRGDVISFILSVYLIRTFLWKRSALRLISTIHYLRQFNEDDSAWLRYACLWSCTQIKEIVLSSTKLRKPSDGAKVCVWSKENQQRQSRQALGVHKTQSNQSKWTQKLDVIVES